MGDRPGHVGTTSTTDDSRSGIGLQLFDGSGSLIGTLVRTPGQAISSFGPLAIQTPSGGLVKFRSGFYLSGTSANPVQLQIDAQGNILNQTNATLDSGSTGGSAPSFSSTQAAQTQSEQFTQAQTQRDAEIATQAAAERVRTDALAATALEEFNVEQNLIAEEGANRRQRLGTLSDLIRGFLDQQSQARDTLANLPADDFRFAAVAGGIAPFGTTPQQGFQQQLQQLAGAAVPQFDPSGSAASLDPIIAQLTGVQAPQQQQGFAGGGTVPTPFNTMSARLVGEGGPEVMVTSPQGVTILPLGKGAQEGGFFPFQPIEFDSSTLLPALTTSGIFQSGQNIPRGTAQPDQSIAGFGGGLGFPTGFMENLGIRPSFFSIFGKDEIFFRDPNTPGEFRLVTGDAVNQIQPRSVVQVSDTAQFGTLRNEPLGINASELSGSLATVRDTSPFTKFSAPIFEPTTGTLLPAPFTVASQMNRLRLTNPGAFNLLLSAYEAAGVPATSVLGTIQQALPFGQARNTIGLN